MKYLNTFYCPLTFLLIIFLLTNCTKEDHEKLRKEAFILKLVNDINADSLKSDVIWLQNMGTRFAFTDNRRSVAQKIKDRFIQIGFPDAEIDSFLVTKTYRDVLYEQWNYNIIAVISGTQYPDSLCIIGGHYDNILGTGDPFTIVPGANDNASGVAAALEIARVMKKNNFAPESKIMFIAFGAEELGLWGSKDFAASPDGFSQKIRFMLNNDMIAYEPADDPSGWCVNIIDYDNSHNLRADAEKMCTRYTFLNYKNDNTSSSRSDSYPFFTNGYKALFFASDKVDQNYHTLNDLLENCNFDYCREIVRISCALLADKN
ncbi:MAG: M20/M25/M40 family metallo-hydrolase [Bacteroidales bacterium]|nr:M20/M25/M40 family metallo-hydrolase [Bacteroidales bacterium]